MRQSCQYLHPRGRRARVGLRAHEGSRQGCRHDGRGRAGSATSAAGDRDGAVPVAQGHGEVREVLPDPPQDRGRSPAGDRLHQGGADQVLVLAAGHEAGVLPPGGAVLPLDGRAEGRHRHAGVQGGGRRLQELRGARRPHRADRARRPATRAPRPAPRSSRSSTARRRIPPRSRRTIRSTWRSSRPSSPRSGSCAPT